MYREYLREEKSKAEVPPPPPPTPSNEDLLEAACTLSMDNDMMFSTELHDYAQSSEHDPNQPSTSGPAPVFDPLALEEEDYRRQEDEPDPNQPSTSGPAPAFQFEGLDEDADTSGASLSDVFKPIVFPENDCIDNYVDYDLGDNLPTDREWQSTKKKKKKPTPKKKESAREAPPNTTSVAPRRGKFQRGNAVDQTTPRGESIDKPPKKSSEERAKERRAMFTMQRSTKVVVPDSGDPKSRDAKSDEKDPKSKKKDPPSEPPSE